VAASLWNKARLKNCPLVQADSFLLGESFDVFEPSGLLFGGAFAHQVKNFEAADLEAAKT
jgi:hypothetical protein